MKREYKEKLRTDLINRYMKENNITKREFCKQCKISHSQLKRMYKNDFDFYIESLYKVCKILNVELKDMFKVVKN